MEPVYLDNAATSWPKPPEVAAATERALREGGTYGRAATPRSWRATAEVEGCRDLLAAEIGVGTPERVAFALNATQALNAVLFGLELRDCEILVSPLEHNSVSRPVERLVRAFGCAARVMPADADGRVRCDELRRAVTPRTKLAVVCHMSNVNGLLQPLREIKEALGDVPLLADASQSAGHAEIKADEWNLDGLAFSGHKGLLGPTGTGAFFWRRPEELVPPLFGGTGSRSESVEMPEALPDRWQGGTPNVVGIAGLKAALEHRPKPLLSRGDWTAFLDELERRPRVRRLLRAANPAEQGPVASILPEGESVSALAMRLLEERGIETRPGLHCAPAAHRFLGSFPDGAVRVSAGPWTTARELETLLGALS